MEEGTKFIIFGHHMTMLNAIEVCLTKCGTDFIRIDGTTRSDLRNDLVTQFQNSTKCRVAVLSIQACHAGLTLTAASMVVFAELVWNPSLLHQGSYLVPLFLFKQVTRSFTAESRAHRMGQTSKVVCRYLFAESTADPHIWKLLKEKQKTLKKAGLCTEDFADGILKKAGAVAATVRLKTFEAMRNLLINFRFRPTIWGGKKLKMKEKCWTLAHKRYWTRKPTKNRRLKDQLQPLMMISRQCWTTDKIICLPT